MRWIPVLAGGSIPACAGEPEGEQGYIDQAAVYPRVCGGTYDPDTGHDDIHGLSPRVRGNPLAN